MPAACDKGHNILEIEKKRCGFSSAGLSLRFRPRSIPSRNYKIAYSRQHFNDSVLAFNNTIETFPGLWFAKRMGRKTREMLRIPEAAREVPKVKF